MSNRYPEQNNTNFPTQVTKFLSEYKIKKGSSVQKHESLNESIKLFSYQKLLEKYLAPSSPYRGLLIMHGLGSGKTINAINIAHNSDRDIVVLLPKSLKQNFIDELINYVPEYNRPNNYSTLSEKEKQSIDKQILKKISKRYSFVSSNAGTAAKKLTEVGVKKENDKALGKFSQSVKSLDNKILIIDEVHNLLVNMIDPTAKNGSKILEQIMNAKNLRLIFLSGSPVVSDPFELAILYNMLRGYIRIKGSNELYTAFPREYDTFNKYFVDKDTNTIKNKEVFQERIVGLTSYYIGATNDTPDSSYPYRHLPTVVKVHMSGYQWKLYIKFRNQELDEERKSKYAKTQFTKMLNKKPGRQSNTTFRVKTRQISDFALPLGITKPDRKGKTGIPLSEAEIKARTLKVLNSIPKRDLMLSQDLKKYSPKMMAILTKINSLPGNAFVYSQFVSLEGIGVFARVLEANGYTNYNKTKQLSPRTFAVYSGDTSDALRTTIINKYNAPSNARGKQLRILLATATAAEGINLKNTRQVHIIEPYWHANRIDQIIGRAVRNNSHADLPKSERDVRSFIYLSVPPKQVNIKRTLKEKYTTDEQLFYNALKRQKLLNTFTDAMKEIAIDCTLNKAHNKTTCKLCAPTNKRMYPPRVSNHILPGGSNCISEHVVKSSDLTTITKQGKTYKKDKTTGQLYEFSEDMGVWIPTE